MSLYVYGEAAPALSRIRKFGTTFLKCDAIIAHFQASFRGERERDGAHVTMPERSVHVEHEMKRAERAKWTRYKARYGVWLLSVDG